MQDMHPKTLACTLLLDTTGRDTDKKFFERLIQIKALCEDKTPFHLKIQAWHRNNKKFGVLPGPPRLENFKELLMPRQHILKAFDPDFTKSTEEVIKYLTPMAQEYEMFVLNDEYEQVQSLDQALNVYETFHHLTRDATWGKVPLACSCEGSHADAICEHGALFTAVFDPDIEVPEEYVAAEPALRKRCHKLKGTAGPKRMRLMAEIAKGKKKAASKMGLMDMEGSGPSSAVQAHLPPAVSAPPTNLVIPPIVFPDSDSDFEVRFMHAYTWLWLICSDSGDRRMDLAGPGAPDRNLLKPRPSPSPWPNPRTRGGLCHSP